MSDVWSLSSGGARSWARVGISVAWVAAVLMPWMALLGCDGKSETPKRAPTTPSAPLDPRLDPQAWPAAPAEWLDEHTAIVERACARCHRLPPPHCLPREKWRDVIVSMVTMPAGETLTLDELALSLSYYQRLAPEALQAQLPVAEAQEGGRRFRVEHFTPRGLENERIPAISHVTFVDQEGRPELDLMATDMRTSTLLVQSPWKAGARQLHPFAGSLNYPSQIRVGDVDGDGRRDFLISALGGMDPTNDSKGSVLWLSQGVDGRFRGLPLARSLPRVADARAVDVDGDGVNEVVVSAFGWRGPGSLYVLTHESKPIPGSSFGSVPLRKEEIDTRDGALHIIPGDFDEDGRDDFVVLFSQEHEELVFFRRAADGTYQQKLLYQAPHVAWGSSGVVAFDFDGDGDRDFLLSNGDTLDDQLLKPYHGIRILENRGGLEFVAGELLPFYGCERAIPADMDGDGDFDIVAASFLPQFGPDFWQQHDLDSVVWFEWADNHWRRHVIEKQRCYHSTLAVGDYNNDGRLDIVVGNYVWLEQNSQARFQADYISLFTQQ